MRGDAIGFRSASAKWRLLPYVFLCSFQPVIFAQGFIDIPKHVFTIERIDEARRQAIEQKQPVIFLAGKDWSM